MSTGGIFSKDSRVDDKNRQGQGQGQPQTAVPGVVAQRVPAPPAVTTTPPVQPATSQATDTGSKLIVGPNIKLKSAEITDCDTLVVEGHVDGTVASLAIVIAQTGTLNGTATIDNAEIRGEFKGELTVRKRLMICSTGKVTGKIAYGKLVIEEGGELVGEIQAMHGGAVVANHLEPAPLRVGVGTPPPMPGVVVNSRH